MNVTCPECHATLEPDEIDREKRECPLCGASLAALDLSAIEDQLSSEEVIAGNPLSARDDADASENSATSAPEASVLEVIEETPDRLVVHLPPNPNGAAGLGFFAFAWNAFMALFTSVFYFAMRDKAQFEIVPLLFIGLFWLVGIGMLVSWVRTRFTRVFLLLEKDRLVVQRKLWTTSNRELLLGADRKAVLEESYRINEVPVHQVTVQGEGRKESFGVGLPEADKITLAQKLNQFLGVESDRLIPTGTEAVCSICGAIVEPSGEDTLTTMCESCRTRAEERGPGTLWPVLRAGSDELPDGLVVDDADPGLITIQYPLLPLTSTTEIARKTAYFFVAIGFTIVGVVIFRSLQHGIKLSSLFQVLVFSIPAFSLVTLAMAVTRGRTWIQLSREVVQMRWGWGPMSIRKQFLVSSITECGIMRGQFQSQKESPSPRNPTPFAAIKAGGIPYPLTTIHGTEYGQKVVRLVRTYLEDLTGQSLP